MKKKPESYPRLFVAVFVVAISLFSSVSSPLRAAGLGSDINTNIFQQLPGSGRASDSGNTIVGAAIDKVVTYLIFVAGVVAIIYLLIGGMNYITAGGDEEKAKKARLTVLYAILGIIVIAGVYFIFNASLDLASTLAK